MMDSSAEPKIWKEKGVVWYTLVFGQGVCLDEICQILVQRVVCFKICFLFQSISVVPLKHPLFDQSYYITVQ